MSVVINVHDSLARRLHAEAARRSQSVEELATTILENAVPRSEADLDWGPRNRRRLELIRKSTRGELTEREQSELDELQNWLDQQFESFDAGLLNQLDEMKHTVQRLSAEQRHA
jgi:plasmid stability protein